MAETSGKTAWYAEDVATFGDRLTAAREMAGLTQADLATKMGVRQKTLAAWESDSSEPRGNRLQMVAGMLSVSMRWLLTGVGDDLAEPGSPGAMTTPAKVALADLARIRGQMKKLSTEIERTEARLRVMLQSDQVAAE
jgi:HTH-type transcriptional regulator, cell division transcriptional repressor